MDASRSAHATAELFSSVLLADTSRVRSLLTDFCASGHAQHALFATAADAGRTLAHAAAESGLTEVLALLNATSEYGSELQRGSVGGDASASRAWLDAKDSIGRTPLLCAIVARQRVAVELLLRYGADVCLVDIYGTSAWL